MFLSGRVTENIQLVEAKQRRSAMLRASHHMHGNVITTNSRTYPKRNEHAKKPFAMHSMKVLELSRPYKGIMPLIRVEVSINFPG